MALTVYPGSLDSWSAKANAVDTVLADHVNKLQEAMEAVQIKLGADGSGTITTIDYLLKNVASSNPGHKHTLADGATNVTATAAEVNKLSGTSANVTSTNLNTLTDGSTSTTLHKHQLAYGASDVTATAAQVNDVVSGMQKDTDGTLAANSDTRYATQKAIKTYAAPVSHAVNASTYGYGDGTNAGHLRVGTGLTISTGTVSVTYGSSASTACEGNDSRLTNNRTPVAHQLDSITYHTVSGLTIGHFLKATGATTFGFAAHGLTYTDVSAAPTSHAVNASTYGYGDGTNAGHLRVGTGLTVSTGTISVTYGSTASTSCQGNDSRLSDTRTPVAHAVNASTYGYGDTTNAGHLRVGGAGSGLTVSTGTISITPGSARYVLATNSGASAVEWVTSLQSILTVAGDMIYASSANTPARIAKGSAYYSLNMKSDATIPEWQASIQSIMTAQGDTLYASAANTPARLAKGSAYYSFNMNAAGTIPEWQASLQSLFTAQGDTIYASGANTPAKLSKGTALQYYRMNAGETAPEWVTVCWDANSSPLVNLGLAASVGSNILTVALKTKDGNDPSAASGVQIGFRSATVTSGTSVIRTITSAMSVALSSGSTLGFTAAESGRIYVWAIDNAGTVELALSRTADIFPECNLVTTTAEGGAGGADSATTMYSTSARSSVAFRCLGYIEITTGATPGQWSNAPTKIQVMGPGVRRTGEVVQEAYTYRTDMLYSSHTLTEDLLSISFTPTSSLNKIKLEGSAFIYASGGYFNYIYVQIKEDGVTKASTSHWSGYAGGGACYAGNVYHEILAASTSARTYKITGTYLYTGAGGGGGCYWNNNGTYGLTYLKIIEIFA